MGCGQTDAYYASSLGHCDQEENDITLIFLKPVQAVGGSETRYVPSASCLGTTVQPWPCTESTQWGSWIPSVEDPQLEKGTVPFLYQSLRGDGLIVFWKSKTGSPLGQRMGALPRASLGQDGAIDPEPGSGGWGGVSLGYVTSSKLIPIQG